MKDSAIRKPGGLVFALFFLSGFSGLIYELVWVRMLTMYVGGGNFSVSIVLTVFMAGLALGSALAGRLVDRIEKPSSLVAAYGLLELAIGVYGLLFPFILAACEPGYAFIYRHIFSSLLGYGLASSVLSTLLLLIPATLMGATLPLLSRYIIEALPVVGTRTGLLYGLNTIGGALGALITGFWLIQWFGVTGTLWTAVTINTVIGVVCLVAFGGTGVARSLASDLRHSIPATHTRVDRQFAAACAVLAASGFCAMACEVIWTKLLGLLVGPTMYSFTIILFTFITGLALGSVVFGWVCDRSKNPFLLLLATQLAAAVSMLVVSQLLGNSQLFFAKVLSAFQGDLRLMELSKVAALFVFMVTPTIFLGAAFPIAARIGISRADTVGSSVGTMYSANTIGALLGSFLAGFAMIPLMGKAHSLSLLACLQAVVAGAAYLAVAPGRGGRLSPALATVSVVILAAALLPRWDNVALAQAKYYRFYNFSSTLERMSYAQALIAGTDRTADKLRCDRVLYLDDGIGGFVAVGETESGLTGTNRFLSISGKADASSVGDLYTFVLTGQIPMLLHSNAASAMVIGLASGITAGEMLNYPLKQLDVLEISPQVVKACAYFSPWNNGVLTDSRVNIIEQDARTHLTLTDRKYDIIVSEPSNPWMAGIANLFSADFYNKVKSRLNPGGIFVQWVHAYQCDWEMFCMQGRTFASVFPRGFLMNTSMNGDDYFLVATRDGENALNLSTIAGNLRHAQKSRNMRMADHRLLLPLVRSENFGTLFDSGDIHRDDLPLLEYLAPGLMYAEGGLEPLIQARQDISPETRLASECFTNVEYQVAFAEFMASMNSTPFGLVDMSRANETQADRYHSAVERYSRIHAIPDYDIIRDAEDRRICATVQKELFLKYLASATERTVSQERLGATYLMLGHAYTALRDYEQAILAYQESLTHLPRYGDTLTSLAACLETAGRHERAIEILTTIAEVQPGSARTIARIGANHLKLGHSAEALSFFMKALEIDPAFGPALQAVGAIYGTMGDYPRAIDYSRRAIESAPGVIRPYQNIVIALANSGKLQEAREYVALGLSIDPTNEMLLSVGKMLGSEKK